MHTHTQRLIAVNTSLIVSICKKGQKKVYLPLVSHGFDVSVPFVKQNYSYELSFQ